MLMEDLGNDLLDDADLAVEQADAERDLEVMKDAVLSFGNDTKENARAAMGTRLRRFNRYRRRYNNERNLDTQDSSLFKDVNIPKLAKKIDVAVAQHMSLNVPDRSRLDFFSLTPEPSDTGEAIEQLDGGQADAYAKWAEAVVRQDLVDSHWVSTYKDNLQDLYILGNMVAMVCYEQSVRYSYEMTPNPEYKPELGVAGIVDLDETAPDGYRPRPQFTRKRVGKLEYDAPKVRYLNPMNVWPTELDRRNIADCSGVCIYDTTRKDELQGNEIGNGGYLYTDLDQIDSADTSETVPEIDNFYKTQSEDNSKTTLENIPSHKLRRVTYIGRFVLDELLEGKEISEAGKQAFYKKYAVDETKRENWKTWVIEIINDKYVVRCQPLPYEVDAIPIVHFKRYGVTNETLGYGEYDRSEWQERIWNFFNRGSMELTMKMIRPPVGLVSQLFDSKWLMAKDGKLTYVPDEIWPLANGASINQAFQPMKFDSAPLQHCYEGMHNQDRSTEEMSVPPVKSGAASGGKTATEVQMIGANADIIVDQTAQDAETEFLHPMIEWILKLHHQYTTQERSFRRRNDSGIIEQLNIPPDVWTRTWSVDILGYRSVGNLAVRQAQFGEFAKIAMSTNRANMDELLKEYAKLFQIRNADRLISPPPPPGPALETKLNLSLSLDQTLTPPAIVGKLLAGQPIDEADMALMGVMPPAMPMEGGGPSPMQGPDMESVRDHHAPGELEMRNRGVKDEQGVARGTSQKARDPNNSRMARA